MPPYGPAPSRPAARIARATSSAWALGLGTVKPLVRPPWLIAVPRMTASTRSPSRTASDSGLSTTAPTPSAGVKPSGRSPNVWQCPARDSICIWQSQSYLLGCRYRLTAPTNARRHSPLARLSHARCSAVSEDAHAVSTGMLGPCRSRQYESRLGMDHSVEVGITMLPRRHWSGPHSRYDCVVTPTKTPIARSSAASGLPSRYGGEPPAPPACPPGRRRRRAPRAHPPPPRRAAVQNRGSKTAPPATEPPPQQRV